ncbi:MAG: PPC domain-containing protein [Isosphaeraceae bacterium]|nr:PPC domain-containing protein [Isosphaeraceae bacterium]
MRRFPTGVGLPAAVLALVFASGLAHGDVPSIGGITPFGAQRGVATEVTIAGGGLAGSVELIAPFGTKIEAPGPNKDAGKWTFKATVDPKTPVGVYVVRVKHEGGISNPFLFAVGQLPQVAEKEENSSHAVAQPFTAPAVIEGQAAGNDVDYYRFAGKAGQRIVVDAQCARIGSGVDPSIRLTTAARKYVASADDTPGLLTDARLTAVLPVDGDYIVEISDSRYQGGGRPIYRLVVGELPVVDEVFPLGGRRGETVGFELKGGTLTAPRLAVSTLGAPAGMFAGPAALAPCPPDGSTQAKFDLESLPSFAISDYPEVREPVDPAAPALELLPPVVINGRIETKGDQDRFILAVTPGRKYHVEVDAANLGSALDGVLEVQNMKGGRIAQADDTTAQGGGRNNGNRRNLVIVSPDPTLTFTVPADQNQVALVLKDLNGEGGLGFPYRISVEPEPVSFDLALGDPQISIPKGGTVSIPVSVSRLGYNGPITLTVADPPAGLTVRPGTVVEGQNSGSFTITAAPDSAFPLQTLKVVGRATGPNGPLEEVATKAVVFAQQAGGQGALPTNIVTFTGLPAAPALPAPIRINAPDAPVEVVHGFSAAIPLEVARDKGVDDALTVSAVISPPNQPYPSIGVPLAYPNGIAIPNAPIAAKELKGTVTVNAAPEAPLGTATLVVEAKGKVGGKDQTFGIPRVQVNVVRPAALEIPAGLDIKAGATAKLEGKLLRKAPFKDPVTLKIEGLPAGVSVKPVTIAPDQSTFTLEFTADAKAAVAEAAAKVSPAFQLNKKDYATPPSPLKVKVLAAK